MDNNTKILVAVVVVVALAALTLFGGDAGFMNWDQISQDGP